MTALYFGWPAFRNRHFVIWGGGGGAPHPLYSSLHQTTLLGRGRRYQVTNHSFPPCLRLRCMYARLHTCALAHGRACSPAKMRIRIQAGMQMCTFTAGDAIALLRSLLYSKAERWCGKVLGGLGLRRTEPPEGSLDGVPTTFLGGPSHGHCI